LCAKPAEATPRWSAGKLKLQLDERRGSVTFNEGPEVLEDITDQGAETEN
jgi:hypothetical protein